MCSQGAIRLTNFCKEYHLHNLLILILISANANSLLHSVDKEDATAFTAKQPEIIVTSEGEAWEFSPVAHNQSKAAPYTHTLMYDQHACLLHRNAASKIPSRINYLKKIWSNM